MKIILKVDTAMKDESVDLILDDDGFDIRNFVTLQLGTENAEIYVPDLQRALEAFRYPTPEEIEQNNRRN